ncbi:MAG TPA: hypothetical protein VF590_14050 [Isosphaeraceae bacterium]
MIRPPTSPRLTLRLGLLAALGLSARAGGDDGVPEVPHLRMKGTATQLVVDGAPLVILP